MGRRLQLHEVFREMLGTETLPMELSRVYFQPPEGLKMDYPCIVYERDVIESLYSNNKTYNQRFRYQVTVIDKNPDSPLVENMTELPLCKHARHFTTSGLNHDVYDLYY